MLVGRTGKSGRREYLVENEIDDQQQSEASGHTEEDGAWTGGGHFGVKLMVKNGRLGSRCRVGSRAEV